MLDRIRVRRCRWPWQLIDALLLQVGIKNTSSIGTAIVVLKCIYNISPMFICVNEINDFRWHIRLSFITLVIECSFGYHEISSVAHGYATQNHDTATPQSIMLLGHNNLQTVHRFVYKLFHDHMND